MAKADLLEDGHDRIICPREAGAAIHADHGLNPADIDENADKILRRLIRHGFQAYLVGGCVRDLLCGLHPKDFDIATSATPRQIRKLFRNSRVIGRRFRLVHIHFGDEILEVSTFRREASGESEAVDFGDAELEAVADTDAPADDAAVAADESDLLIRHDNVFGRADEDARRRDFTINALFFDVKTQEVIDFVGGMNDLRARRIETIGEPIVRLREDPVRILRAAKFAGRLGFEIAADLSAAIRETHQDISRAAAPRVYEELQRLLDRGGAARSFEILLDTGVLGVLLTELAAHVSSSPERRERFFAVLRALDRQVIEGRSTTPTGLLSALFLTLFEDFLLHEGPIPDGESSAGYDIGGKVDEILDPIAARLQMPRRDLYRIKQNILGLRRLISRKGARRKPSPSQVVRKDYFADSLRLFAIYARALGRMQGEVIRWEERYEEVTGREFD